jgi:hypothetical protein
VANGPERARRWMELVCSDAHYPDKQNLRAHFLAAELTDFCDCGCNSFKVRIPTGISLLPLAKPGGGGAFFDCAFFWRTARHRLKSFSSSMKGVTSATWRSISAAILGRRRKFYRCKNLPTTYMRAIRCYCALRNERLPKRFLRNPIHSLSLSLLTGLRNGRLRPKQTW